jgi:hypothetical protein
MEFERSGHRIKLDVAWEIFEELNELNEQEKHIDLSCLDYSDALIIAKQKIYDLACKVRAQF